MKRDRRLRDPETFDPGLMAAIAAAGGRVQNLAAQLGLTTQAVAAWKQVPLKYLLAIEKATGVSRRKLRPDMFEPRKQA